jgi:hypothetical protein
MLDKKPGPCRMRNNNTRYYYDKTMKKCLPFEVILDIIFVLFIFLIIYLKNL